MTEPSSELDRVLSAIRACRTCIDSPEGAPLPHEPRPVLRLSATSRLLVAGQAPGTRVHASGIPFTDPSGDRLRAWMGVDSETFYDATRIAVVPMGFCFPGLDAQKSDLPPRRECRKKWHDDLFAVAPRVELILAVGRYAQDYHLTRLGHVALRDASVTDIVSNWRIFSAAFPKVFPLPHPSWRNSGWLKRNRWFEAELLPKLREDVARLMAG